MLVDGLAVMMLFVVTLISLLVHVYSTDYVRGDRRYTHYFAFLSLFTASMLVLVMAETRCSCSWAGSWWASARSCSSGTGGRRRPTPTPRSRPSSPTAWATSACCVGVIILFFAAGQTFDILEINETPSSGEDQPRRCCSWRRCSLFARVMSKSGQFILHTWLPDAMAGPTPVSALIHAATMVVAGVYMVARLYGVFFEGLVDRPSSVNLWPSSAASPCSSAPASRFVQNDIKKVLAYSTVSPARLHGDGARRRRLDGRLLPPLHPRLLQGLPLPRVGLGQPRRAHAFDMKQDMGGLQEVHAHDLLDLPDRLGGAHRHLPARRLLVEGRDPRRRLPGRATAPTRVPGRRRDRRAA